MNYEQDLYIDEAALDIEWLEQAALALQYGRHWAECQQELTRTEEKVKVIRAELVKEAHEDPDRYLEGAKPTGPVVEAYYRNHKRHKAAKDAWVEAQYEFNMATIAKWEISNTRKAALENLVKLHGQQYFAGPTLPKDITEQRQIKQKAANHGVSEKLKRTKKQKNGKKEK